MHNFIYRGSPLGALQHAEAEINGNDHRILQVVWEALSGSYTYFNGLVSNNPIRQTSLQKAKQNRSMAFSKKS